MRSAGGTSASDSLQIGGSLSNSSSDRPTSTSRTSTTGGTVPSVPPRVAGGGNGKWQGYKLSSPPLCHHFDLTGTGSLLLLSLLVFDSQVHAMYI